MLDTSVIIDLMTIERERLPLEGTIAALTIAELTAGPVAASDAVQRAQRLERLQQTEALFETIPFDRAAAHAYARSDAREPKTTRLESRRYADRCDGSFAWHPALYTQPARFWRRCHLDGDRRRLTHRLPSAA